MERARTGVNRGPEGHSPLDKAIKLDGSIAIFHGNFAPDGCVIKLSRHQRTNHLSPARVLNRNEDAFKVIQERKTKANDVIVIRYERPKGGGMRGMRHVTGARQGAGLGDKVAQG